VENETLLGLTIQGIKG